MIQKAPKNHSASELDYNFAFHFRKSSKIMVYVASPKNEIIGIAWLILAYIHQRYESFLTFGHVGPELVTKTLANNICGRDFFRRNGIFKKPSFSGGIFYHPVLNIQSYSETG